MTTIREKIAALKLKRAEQDKLIAAFENALRIEELWPAAFEGGSPVFARAVGNVNTGVVYILVRMTDEQERRFDLNDVPRELWPAELVDALNTYHRSGPKRHPDHPKQIIH